jgi:hypothetical protein
MNKFRKRPVVIEAIQFTGTNFFECSHFMDGDKYLDVPELKATDYPVIHTLEGTMTATPGDWIIKGIRGEFYPCKPDIFAATYEKVDS